jgi:hypothetical protein
MEFAHNPISLIRHFVGTSSAIKTRDQFEQQRIGERMVANIAKLPELLRRS